MPHRVVPAPNRVLAKGMRRKMPGAEFQLWCELRNRGLAGLRFRRQQPIGPYIVDFYCPAVRLIVEVDGGQHALGERPKGDAERTRRLEVQGNRLVRFWTNEVMHDIDGVCAAILAASRGEWRNESARNLPLEGRSSLRAAGPENREGVDGEAVQPQYRPAG